MSRGFLFYLVGLIFILSGCVVRTYQVTRDRVDQDLSQGNRGYLMGEAQAETQERKLTRTTQIVEVELSSPIKFERKPKPVPVQASELQSGLVEKTDEDTQLWGNQGFMTPGAVGEAAGAADMEKYTVQKNDSLQKISQKFYGTTKKWAKIYEANKDSLKGPNKIYPGQVLNIPVESLKEPSENLK